MASYAKRLMNSPSQGEGSQPGRPVVPRGAWGDAEATWWRALFASLTSVAATGTLVGLTFAGDSFWVGIACLSVYSVYAAVSPVRRCPHLICAESLAQWPPTWSLSGSATVSHSSGLGFSHPFLVQQPCRTLRRISKGFSMPPAAVVRQSPCPSTVLSGVRRRHGRGPAQTAACRFREKEGGG